MSVTLLQIDSSSFPSSHFWHVISPCGTLQNVFDSGPLTPKIYSPKFGTKSHITQLVWQIDRRCLGLLGGFRGSPIQWNHRKCCGADPCCHSNEIWAKIAYNLACLSLCLSRSFKSILLFCFSMESSHILAVGSPCGTLQNVVLDTLLKKLGKIGERRSNFDP